MTALFFISGARILAVLISFSPTDARGASLASGSSAEIDSIWAGYVLEVHGSG